MDAQLFMEVVFASVVVLVVLIVPLYFPPARRWLAINPMASRLAGGPLYWRHANRLGKMVLVAFYFFGSLMGLALVIAALLERRGPL